jgi:hypothetical protein
VYANRKHINYRPHSDGSDDYYCNYYDTKVLVFEMNHRDVRMPKCRVCHCRKSDRLPLRIDGVGVATLISTYFCSGKRSRL